MWSCRDTGGCREEHGWLHLSRVSTPCDIETACVLGPQPEACRTLVPEKDKAVKHCCIYLPDGATCVVAVKSGFSIKEILAGLCERHGINGAAVDLFLVGGDKVLSPHGPAALSPPGIPPCLLRALEVWCCPSDVHQGVGRGVGLGSGCLAECGWSWPWAGAWRLTVVFCMAVFEAAVLFCIAVWLLHIFLHPRVPRVPH